MVCKKHEKCWGGATKMRAKVTVIWGLGRSRAKTKRPITSRQKGKMGHRENPKSIPCEKREDKTCCEWSLPAVSNIDSLNLKRTGMNRRHVQLLKV